MPIEGKQCRRHKGHMTRLTCLLWRISSAKMLGYSQRTGAQPRSNPPSLDSRLVKP